MVVYACTAPDPSRAASSRQICLYHETKSFAGNFVDGTFLFGIGGRAGDGDDDGNAAGMPALHDTPALLRMFGKVVASLGVWCSEVIVLGVRDGARARAERLPARRYSL